MTTPRPSTASAAPAARTCTTCTRRCRGRRSRGCAATSAPPSRSSISPTPSGPATAPCGCSSSPTAAAPGARPVLVTCDNADGQARAVAEAVLERAPGRPGAARSGRADALGIAQRAARDRAQGAQDPVPQVRRHRVHQHRARPRPARRPAAGRQPAGRAGLVPPAVPAPRHRQDHRPRAHRPAAARRRRLRARRGRRSGQGPHRAAGHAQPDGRGAGHDGRPRDRRALPRRGPHARPRALHRLVTPGRRPRSAWRRPPPPSRIWPRSSPR